MPHQYDTREGPARFEISDLRGMSPVQMRLARVEFHARARDLHEDSGGQARNKTDSESREFKHCIALIDAIDAHLAWDSEVRGTISRHPRSLERAGLGETRDRPTFRGVSDDQVPPRVAEDRDRAMRTLEEYRSDDILSAAAADRIDEVLRYKDPVGGTARYLSAVGDPDYASAFGKILADPQSGHLRFSAEEVEAMRATGHVQAEMRAMGEATGAAGSFLLPFQLDPSILLSNAGALNPVRDISSVEVGAAFQWKGVSSAGVTAAYAAEAAEAGDNSPTLAQPVITPQRGQCFVPFSREVSQDWVAVQAELTRLVTDAKAVVDATMFLTGVSGSNQPIGILAGDATYSLTTTQRVLTATTSVTAVADPWSLKAQIPARWLNLTTFAAAPATWDAVYRFVAQGSTTEPRQFADGDRGGDFLGRPKVEWSTMASTMSTTGAKLMIGGSFRDAYKIIDRLGMEAEIVPHLFGASSRPTGQRGLYAMWRTGASVILQNALRYLEVK